ncbi:glycoside hydrolase family 65 protein [Kordiimonas marina]|uniref:glycoside hydrolase family 65 protein n=1 Tax=Kordiimonas marina TaxID=2872312 RepID=UPI001FF1B4AD|nr:glycosyl hydrolase family 65 protein [Kordiimonas marina]MCJ9430672.1 hypothetical protein [Kordiimonas marina]
MADNGAKTGGKAPVLGTDPWRVAETAFSGDTLGVVESLFALANGYIGTRGTFEEPVTGDVASTEGTYLNGVYLREPIHYDESAYGFATHNNKMILVPNGKAVGLTAGDEAFVHGDSSVEAYARALDMKAGMLSRTTRWRTKAGGALDIASRRIVSLAHNHLMAFEYKVTSVDYAGPVSLTPGLDAGYGGTARAGDPRAGELSIRDCLIEEMAETRTDGALYTHRIKDSDVRVVSAIRFLTDGATVTAVPVEGDRTCGTRLTADLAPGESLTLTVYVWYGHGTDAFALTKTADAELFAAVSGGFAALVAAQAKAYDAFWATADMEVGGAPGVEQGMRFGMFHLCQSAGRNGDSSIGSKGLTGPGYDGHYFWDTEIYIVPFLTYTCPEVARSLLQYRIGKLDEARARAREMAHTKGGLFPWRTIGGEECSSYFPAGTAQYHINAAIAYAALQYLTVTEDWSFVLEGGAELLFETAQLWLDLGHFSERRGGQFCIHEVTGPDEYSAMSDNNFYTNAMARHHLKGAARLAAEMAKRAPDAYAALTARIGLAESDVTDWARAAEKMYLPYDEELQVHAQDDLFLARPKWDFASTPAENYPLLLHYHPLVIYRHQVLKQADVVLADVLLSGAFTEDEKRRDLAYYEPLTTHDSTLSACIYAVANAEVGSRERAYHFFEETYRMDLENRHGNTHYGVHTACMAGSWMGVVMGFAGMRLQGEVLTFKPYLPEGWTHYSFHLLFKGRRLDVRVDAEGARYRVATGAPLVIRHAGTDVTVGADADTVCAAA